MERELVIVLDFGGQYNLLIARRVRDLGVYCEVVPYTMPVGELLAKKPKGIIFTGGPSIVFEENAPRCEREIFEAGIPILGICYGSQLISHLQGGTVKAAEKREYGRTELSILPDSLLFEGIPAKTLCWMSHTYYASQIPCGYRVSATSDSCQNAAYENADKKIYAVQFHPEVQHTPEGNKMLHNFLYLICGCKGDWQMSSYVQESIQSLREKLGGKKALCALSGGVDSSVAAMLVHKAIGKNLTCIFVDHGLLRKDEGCLLYTASPWCI